MYLTEVTTNSSGIFSIDEKSLGLSAGDQLKLEKSIMGLNSVKTGHEAVNNRMYEIRLNNLKFNGDGQPSYHVLTTDEYQNIKMDHTQLLFNLVISVEWDAKPEYLDTLKSWIKSMSNYLWDVTDGHLYIKKAAIYDNRKKWDQADIRIFVSNVVWPNASVGGIKQNDAANTHANIPRRWFGDGDMSRNRTALSNWISESDNLFFRASSTTIAHELGHYLFGFFDEYVWVDTNKKKTVPTGYNFGFMQYQYANGGVYSSEMSFPGRYSNNNWKYTAQWVYNGSDCWTQFEKDWEKTYVTSGGGFFCPINKPSERILSSGRDYLLGPLDFNSGQTQCKIDPLTEVQIFNESISSGDVNITCIDDENQLVKKADTYLSLTSSSFMIPLNYQGKTSDEGKIKVLGAKVGQNIAIGCNKTIYIPFIGYQNIYYYKFYTITTVSSHDKYPNDIALNDDIVKLEKVKGDFRFINSLQYDSKGQLNFLLFSKSKLSEIPTLVLTDEKNEAVYFPTRYNENTISYISPINYNLANEGLMQLSLKDEGNNLFFVPLHYSISERKEKMLAPLGSAELTFDPKNSEFRTVAFLISDFFPITEGLVREPEHVGKVLSIASYPEDFQQGSNNLLMMRYNRSDLLLKDEMSLKIHRWEENARKWIVLPSTVDSTEQMVSCLISQNGTYALFTTDISTGYDEIDDKNHFGLRVSPNPITNEADIQFAINNPEFINISVLDNFGRDVMNVISEYKLPGIHKMKINTSSLASGVYYIRLKSGISTSIVKAVIIK